MSVILLLAGAGTHSWTFEENLNWNVTALGFLKANERIFPILWNGKNLPNVLELTFLQNAMQFSVYGDYLIKFQIFFTNL